jgi:cation diffusion facilitator family transporter
MHSHDISRWGHSHDFSVDTSRAQKLMRRVIALTGLMMVVEIVAGSVFNSMALTADGWHMATHVSAFVLTALAYFYDRRHARDPRFSFGTGKISVLGGYTSAVVLAVVAAIMAGESVRRMFAPVQIHFGEAIGIACIGLAVNLVCAFLLRGEPHHHHHGHDDHHGAGHEPHGHPHHDLNLRAAFAHVLADALTSVTAIVALTAGRYLGWVRLDPIMGLVGAGVIGSWVYSLVRDTSTILLDRTPADTDLPVVVRESIESDGDSLITDLHVWQVGAGKFAAIIGVVAHEPKTPEEYREALKVHEELVHVTIEVQVCHSREVSRCA